MQDVAAGAPFSTLILLFYTEGEDLHCLYSAQIRIFVWFSFCFWFSQLPINQFKKDLKTLLFIHILCLLILFRKIFQHNWNKWMHFSTIGSLQGAFETPKHCECQVHEYTVQRCIVNCCFVHRFCHGFFNNLTIVQWSNWTMNS